MRPTWIGRFERACSRADGDRSGGLVRVVAESLGGIVKIDAEFVKRAIGPSEIFMDEMRGANVFAVDPIFPAAVDVVAGMPELVLVSSAEPGEPPVHHLRATAGHAGQRGNHSLAVAEFHVTGFDGQIAGLQQVVGLFKFHCRLPIVFSQNPTLSPPLSASISRASAGVAISWPSSSRMRRILLT